MGTWRIEALLNVTFIDSVHFVEVTLPCQHYAQDIVVYQLVAVFLITGQRRRLRKVHREGEEEQSR